MKRRVVIILLLLISGAIVNIAVAWGVWRVADWEHHDAVEFHLPAPLLLQSAVEDVVDRANLDWKNQSAWHWCVMGADSYNFDWLAYRVGGTTVRAFWLRCGLPFRTVEGGFFFLIGGDKPMSDFHVASLELSDALRQRWFTADMATLPIKPVWPGFIINTLFYAGLLWLLFTTLFAARRALRRRRGLCEKCAYPIGTSPVCTECGAAVRASTL